MAEYKLNYTGEEVQKKLDVVPTDSKPNQYIVTDGNGNAKWEDKLCWSEEGKVTLVEPFTEEYGEEVPNRNRFPLTLEEGKNYTVKWDGVEYDCTCFVDDWNRLVVGNASLMEAGANTNEPCLVGVQDGDSFVKAQTGGDHELSIFGIGETIYPIDKKYLPSDSGGGCLVITVDTASGSMSANMPFNEARNLLFSGAPVVFRQDYGGEVQLFSNTHTTCQEDKIWITVYNGDRHVTDAQFNSDGSIEVPEEG